MFRDKRIPKLQELTASIFCRIGLDHSVMQMNFNLSPTCSGVFRKLLYQATVILFGRIKISVNEWMAVAIAPRVRHPRILMTPEVEAAFLLVTGGAQHSIFWNDRGLEVIRHRNH